MATNFFIKFDGIKGETAVTGFSDQIECNSWSHSFNQPTRSSRSATGGGTVEKANHSDFSFTKVVDIASVDLLKACWSGKQIATATFTALRADGETDKAIPYLEVKMEKVIISNVSVGGGGGEIPSETIALAYGKVTYTYKPQKNADGAGGEQKPTSHDLIADKIS